jgi:KaiC/GvpD/RAD55 family RecA-like ATPase
MTTEFESGAGAARVLRLRANGGGWTPIHVTVHRVELDDGVFAGMLSLRLPTDAEAAAEAAGAPEAPKSRKARRKADAAQP